MQRFASIVFILLFAANSRATDVLTLDDCIRMGLEGNLTLQMQRIQLASASADVLRADAPYDPRLQLNGEYEDSELPPGTFPFQGGIERGVGAARLLQNFSSGSSVSIGVDVQRNLFEGMSESDDPFYRTSAGITLNQSLWRNAFGSADRARTDYVRLRLSSIELEYLRTREQVVAAIVDEFWRAFTAQKIAETQDAVVDRLATLLENNRKRFEDGLLDESAVLAVEASLAVADVDVEVRRHEADGVDEQLKDRINIPVDAWDNTRIDYAGAAERGDPAHAGLTFDDAYANALQYRADMDALRQEEKRVERLIDWKKSEDRADVSVSGSLGRGDKDPAMDDSMDFDKTVWSVGIMADISLKRSGTRGELTQALMERERIRTAMDMLKRSIELECRTALRQFSTALRLVDATRKSLDLQTRKLEREMARYDRGQSDIKTVLDYQNDLETAERDLVKARGSLHRADMALRLVQGMAIPEDAP